MGAACTVQVPSSAPATTAAPAVSGSTTDAAFVSSLIADDANFADVPAATLVGLGREICTSLSGGQSVGAVAQTLISATAGTSITGTDLGVVFSGAVSSYCPQFTSAASDWASANGG